MTNDTKKQDDQKSVKDADLDKAVGGVARPTTPQPSPATPAGTIS